jgi:hypothetical protein
MTMNHELTRKQLRGNLEAQGRIIESFVLFGAIMTFKYTLVNQPVNEKDFLEKGHEVGQEIMEAMQVAGFDPEMEEFFMNALEEFTKLVLEAPSNE